MRKSKILLAVTLGTLFITFIFSCHKDGTISTGTKSLKDNIFVKNADRQLFSYDINTNIVNNKEVSYINKIEVTTLSESSFSERTKPFHYNFKNTDNLIQYIKEGKIWFISNKNDTEPVKLSIDNTLPSSRANNAAATINCECEIFGEGDNECEYDKSDGIHQCWTSACIQCDFIVCLEDVTAVSICLSSTRGGGVFVIADSIVLTNTNTKYVLGQNSILRFEFFETETICYREQLVNTLFNNGLYNLNIPNLNNIANLDSLWFVPFEANVQARNGTAANPTCENDSCDGSCELKRGSDDCYRCKCSKDDATTSCTLKPDGLQTGGVLLSTNSLTVIDL